MKRVLITGGSGFIGHHVIERILLQDLSTEVVCLERLDLSSSLSRLAEVIDKKRHVGRIKVVWHDLKSPINSFVAKEIGDVDVILHLAAQSHVDRSIEDPISFVMDNVVGTANLLEFARTCKSLKWGLYFSTDEVFGPAPDDVKYKEWDRYNSGNPYSATKAGAEELVLAYHNTYGVPFSISHTMNVFGRRQHPEKFVPMTISNVLHDRTVTIHADSTKTISGSRFYIDAWDVADAVVFLYNNAVPGDKYNIVGEKELSNLQLAVIIANTLGKDLNYEMVDFHSARPGHDLRYALDGKKMEGMGWKPNLKVEDRIKEVVEWSLENNRWLL